MSLLQTARNVTSSYRAGDAPITEEEIALYTAYLQREVSWKGVVTALGRSYSYAMNWTRRCADKLFQEKALIIQHQDSKIVWRPKTYQEYLKKQYTPT